MPDTDADDSPHHDLDLTAGGPGPDDPVAAALTAAVATLTPERVPPFEAVLARRRRRRQHLASLSVAATVAALATGAAIALPQIRDGDPEQSAVPGPASTVRAATPRPSLLDSVLGSRADRPPSTGPCADAALTAAERDLRDIWAAALREVTRERGSRWTPAQLSRDTSPTPTPPTWAAQQFLKPMPGTVHACLTSGDLPGVLPMEPATDGTRAVDRRGYLGGYLVRVGLPSGQQDSRYVAVSVSRGPGSEDFQAWTWQVERKPSGWTVTTSVRRVIG